MDAELAQKLIGRAKEGRVADGILTSDFYDQIEFLQLGYRVVTAHTAHFFHVCAGNRLAVSDHRKRFQQGL
ncbi:hypothetical protein SDC9_64571 [bioreactor metagenome]|uniref:Uncharacterized protein n=1 Tax=bioreactor metagenome TaxID=1076179 RepID=A0A644XPV9_9ZZZZ